MRLIDVDALIERHCEGCHEEIRKGCETDPVCATLMWFEEAPTIDAVPVVRCRDCTWCVQFPDGQDMCKAKFLPTKADDFCSGGKRKAGDTND